MPETAEPSLPNAMAMGDVTCIDVPSLQKVDVYISTPPCQSFSQAGKGLGVQDPRGALVWHPLRVCKELRPRVFVFENVARFFYRFKKTYLRFVSELEELGVHRRE